MQPATDALAQFIGGFVAAEGTFVSARGGRRFTFAVGLSASDLASCTVLHNFFGRGHVYQSARRKPHYDDECAFSIASLLDHVEVTIPFMDMHLPESHKREQYLSWRTALLDYWEHDAKRRRPCTVSGCTRLRRAHGLCRHHLYATRGT